MSQNPINTIAVLGAGTMGRGIAQVSAVAGYATRLFDTDGGQLQKAAAHVHKHLAKGVELGKLAAETAEQARNNLSTQQDLALAVNGADLVIEAAPESMSLKIDLFRTVALHAPENAFFASNTSALSITEMAAATGRPE